MEGFSSVEEMTHFVTVISDEAKEAHGFVGSF